MVKKYQKGPKRYINPHLDKALELQKTERDLGFDPLVDDTDKQKEDLIDLDAGIKEHIKKMEIEENKSNLTEET